MEGKKESLINLLSQKDVDPAKIEGLRKEMAGIQDEIQNEVIIHIAEIKKNPRPGTATTFVRSYASEHESAKSLVGYNLEGMNEPALFDE